ncbi:sarcalumenin/eps15 family protein [Cardiosporidium cionae]|uniref:Sarcalumenin/eps15 family protein n=1 Tax=Cardiosporidium cionae TaxID=476202 RepID=A0ABQ7JBG6_9APIC|nr:sarcalumenin/eps15 family protein [Cardiosporidium cionae]|eukprot:KAF8821299.1 sarcalumenin/eps15 family protein [Cardiosporidium cionae]
MMRKKKGPEDLESCVSVLASMQQIYNSSMYPLEQKFFFSKFYSPLLSEGDFDARPMILLLGQYSTGKTTFIRHILERDYNGQLIGPEPTTDRFTAVEYGKVDQLIYGNAAAADGKSPYFPLSDFGNDFLSRFVVSQVPVPILQGVTLIDTPGILSGSKQTSRGYEFESVVKWFAERADLILLFFDAYKLDISDEFQRCIGVLRNHESKIRILLNKADAMANRQLLRVFGALMWSLGKVVNSPEVMRVYVGSFWDQPLKNNDNRQLFEEEANDLFSDIALLPRSSSLRKLNDFVKRMRTIKCHALLLTHLRKQIPLFGKESKKKLLIDKLKDHYETVANENGISIGDFPPLATMQAKLTALDWNTIPKLDSKAISNLDQALSVNMPKYMNILVKDAAKEPLLKQSGSIVDTSSSPFFKLKGSSRAQWEMNEALKSPIDADKYKNDFEALPLDGQNRVYGTAGKADLIKSRLPASVLHRIWNLADVTHDGYLDFYEYCLARHLIDVKLAGGELPTSLPPHLLQFVEDKMQTFQVDEMEERNSLGSTNYE